MTGSNGAEEASDAYYTELYDEVIVIQRKIEKDLPEVVRAARERPTVRLLCARPGYTRPTFSIAWGQ